MRAPRPAFVQCRANVPVPGKAHTFRCKREAFYYGLCRDHQEVPHAHKPD